MQKKTPSEITLSGNKALRCGRPLPVAVHTVSQQRTLLLQMLQKLENYVSEHQLRHSDVRRKIVETIVYEARHFTSLDLLEYLNKRHPEVGKATLYRTLPILIESGIIQEGPTDPSGQVLYEIADETHHDHIVCIDCKRIFEFQDSVIEDRQDTLAKTLSFAPVDHRHVIYAKCEFLKRK